MDQFDDLLQYIIPQGKPMDIKEESPGLSFSLLSPPITPSPPTLPCLPSTSRRRGSSSSLAGSKRPRPYPLVNRDSTSRKDELGTMSNIAYGNSWSGSATRNGHGRSHPPPERRSSDGEDQSTYTLSHQFINEPYLSNIEGGSDLRSISSSSSLTGAMGEASMHTRLSRSPASSHSGHLYTGNVQNPQNHDLTWNTTPMHTNMTIAMNTSAYPGVAGHGGLFTGMSDLPSLNDFNTTTTRNASPESLSPHSPQHYPQFSEAAYPAQGRGMPQTTSATMGFSSHQQMYPGSSTGSPEDEVRRLRRRVQELELECSRTRSALESMRMTQPAGGLPTPPHSAAFQSGWRTRTESRKRIFCSLNRAGNALCAWHDSRRERRAYPPRNAPPGYLNCGCTYDEALFEESLSRHGVGSYLPGETVRMDPALRNPLLKLLQERYSYKDGDFEHDPRTQTWADGESPAVWEKKAQAGGVIRRRADADRH